VTIQSVYVHEAGHLVAAKLCGGRARAVVVFDEAAAYTSSAFLKDADPEALMVYLLAGPQAALAAGYQVDRRDSRDDERRAFSIARRAAWPNIESLGEVAAELFERSERRARLLVEANFREIRHVAATLAAAGGRLAGREVDAALADAFGNSWRSDLPRQAGGSSERQTAGQVIRRSR